MKAYKGTSALIINFKYPWGNSGVYGRHQVVFPFVQYRPTQESNLFTFHISFMESPNTYGFLYYAIHIPNKSQLKLYASSNANQLLYSSNCIATINY